MPEEPKKEILSEMVQQGTNPYLFWCMAKNRLTGKEQPCLMLKESALALGVQLKTEEGQRQFDIEVPDALALSLMGDAYPGGRKDDSKPFMITIPFDLLEDVQQGDDFIAFIMKFSDGPPPG